jgi:hypothetical protein
LQIQRREEIAQKKKQETIEEAQKAIDDFYENYNAQKEKAIAQTRYPPQILPRFAHQLYAFYIAHFGFVTDGWLIGV